MKQEHEQDGAEQEVAPPTPPDDLGCQEGAPGGQRQRGRVVTRLPGEVDDGLAHRPGGQGRPRRVRPVPGAGGPEDKEQEHDPEQGCRPATRRGAPADFLGRVPYAHRRGVSVRSHPSQGETRRGAVERQPAVVDRQAARGVAAVLELVLRALRPRLQECVLVDRLPQVVIDRQPVLQDGQGVDARFGLVHREGGGVEVGRPREEGVGEHRTQQEPLPRRQAGRLGRGSPGIEFCHPRQPPTAATQRFDPNGKPALQTPREPSPKPYRFPSSIFPLCIIPQADPGL